MKRLLSIVAVCLVLGWGLFGTRGLELHQRVLIQAIGIDKTATGYQVTFWNFTSGCSSRPSASIKPPPATR